jgi:hypothetical protein
MAEFDGVNVPEGIASLLREDKEREKRFNTDPDFPVETNRAMILYNAKGEGTFVKGESQILEAIKNGYFYTASTVPDVTPTKDFGEKIYESGFFERPIKNMAEAIEQTKNEERSRAMNFENYDPVVGSASGYEFFNSPRYLTRPFGLSQIGPMDTVRRYNPEKDEMLPKSRPTMSEILMEQGE